MKKKLHTEVTKQQLQTEQTVPIAPKEMEELLNLKAQLKQLKQYNQKIETEIKKVTHTNLLKKNTNNGLRSTFKKLYDEIETLKKEHLLKVQQNLKNQQGPVSALVKDNGFGVSPFSLMKIPAFRYHRKSQQADICMGCYEELQHNSKCKTLPGCEHTFHAQCIDQFLLVSKQCPGCGKDVVV